MRNTKAIQLAHKVQALNRLGFTTAEAFDLFKVERRLHLWNERECNGELYRDEKTGKPFRVYSNGSKWPTRDIETAALKKLEAIETAMLSRQTSKLYFYVQTDPRGVALYICESKDIKPGCTIDQCYSNGLAVYNR